MDLRLSIVQSKCVHSSSLGFLISRLAACFYSNLLKFMPNVVPNNISEHTPLVSTRLQFKRYCIKYSSAALYLMNSTCCSRDLEIAIDPPRNEKALLIGLMYTGLFCPLLFVMALLLGCLTPESRQSDHDRIISGKPADVEEIMPI